MTNPLRIALALFSLTLAACESNEGAELCRDLAFAAPSCDIDPDGCGWRQNADCDDNEAELCRLRLEQAYEATGGTCTTATLDIADTCDACR
jgi:hypothetical protein